MEQLRVIRDPFYPVLNPRVPGQNRSVGFRYETEFLIYVTGSNDGPLDPKYFDGRFIDLFITPCLSCPVSYSVAGQNGNYSEPNVWANGLSSYPYYYASPVFGSMSATTNASLSLGSGVFAPGKVFYNNDILKWRLVSGGLQLRCDGDAAEGHLYVNKLRVPDHDKDAFFLCSRSNVNPDTSLRRADLCVVPDYRKFSYLPADASSSHLSGAQCYGMSDLKFGRVLQVNLPRVNRSCDFVHCPRYCSALLYYDRLKRLLFWPNGSHGIYGLHDTNFGGCLIRMSPRDQTTVLHCRVVMNYEIVPGPSFSPYRLLAEAAEEDQDVLYEPELDSEFCRIISAQNIVGYC